MANSEEKKKETKVINVPKKKKALKTPSQIIRICLIVCFAVCILFLASPFLHTTLYITDDLQTTTSIANAYFQGASQEDVDNAEKELKSAFEALQTAELSDDESVIQYSESENAVITAIGSADYQWSYTIPYGIDAKSLAELIDDAKKIDRSQYTPESVSELNKALMNAQKILCTTVTISQSALQMALGGAIGESFGNNETLGLSISHSIFAFALVFIPFVCFLVLCFDKKSHIKHIVCMVGAILCLLDIFLSLYPYIGRGAVISIVMYIIICVLNIASVYAKQQEDYIVAHPESEADFTEKHPHFVKALINAKSFGQYTKQPDKQEQQRSSAVNAKNKKKKKKK